MGKEIRIKAIKLSCNVLHKFVSLLFMNTNFIVRHSIP